MLKGIMLTPLNGESGRYNGRVRRDVGATNYDAPLCSFSGSTCEQNWIKAQGFVNNGIEMRRPIQYFEIGNINSFQLFVNLLRVTRMFCQLAEDGEKHICCWLALV